MLKQPENVILNDFKMQRQAALDTHLISQYEELVSDWMNTIESILNDTSDERLVNKQYLFIITIDSIL
jgi:dynein heavy chain